MLQQKKLGPKSAGFAVSYCLGLTGFKNKFFCLSMVVGGRGYKIIGLYARIEIPLFPT